MNFSASAGEEFETVELLEQERQRVSVNIAIPDAQILKKLKYWTNRVINKLRHKKLI
jgi:hypothetical protein